MALKDEMDNLMDLEEAYKDPIKDDMKEIVRLLNEIIVKLERLSTNKVSRPDPDGAFDE